LEKVLNVNYKLKLLKGSRIYLIFYVLLFKEAAKATETNNKEIKLKHKLDVYNVKQVLDSKVSKRRHIKYLVK